MTGAYLRAKRNGKFENIEVEHLTDEELREKFLMRTPEELVNWMQMLCENLRRVEPLLLELERDGIIRGVSKKEYDEATTDAQ